MTATSPVNEKEPLRYVTAARMIDCTGAAPVADPVVVLRGKRIEKIGTRETVSVPQGAEVVDCGSCTLMPGMLDVHIHTMMFNCLTFHNYRVAQWEITPELQQMYGLFHAQLCFDMGFTTLRDMGLAASRGLLVSEACAIRDAIDAGIVEGPRMLVAAFTTITGSHLDLIQPRAALRVGFQTADGPWELRKLARTNLLAGCDVIKTCASGGGGTDKEEPDIRNMTQVELDALVDEAHAFHKTCAVHCFTPSAQRMALEAGADTIEHMVFSDDETIGMIKDKGVYVTPTLSHRTDHAIRLRKEQGTSQFVLNKMKGLQEYCYGTFQKMYKAGVNIAMGTDMGFDPEMGTNATELEIYVKLGMTPMHALQTATINAARAIKVDSQLGTLEAGKLADVIAVDGNPLENIACLKDKRNIQMVMKEGRIHADRRPGRSKNVVSAEPGSWKIVDYL
ncbi:MAG: amidohydrolase family protein [Betaproteobacteria bacterium]|nr:amidohydrolase family protein [Betaproteobacteria bacterium]